MGEFIDMEVHAHAEELAELERLQGEVASLCIEQETNQA